MERRLKAYSRNKLATLFETVVPVCIIIIGLCFTQATFLAECPSRPLVVEQYDWKQRILVNTDLVKYNGQFANFTEGTPGTEEDEDFGDDEEGSAKNSWPKDLPVDIDPRILISKLPGYDKGAYLVDYINVTDHVHKDKLARMAEQEAEMREWQAYQKQSAIDQEKRVAAINAATKRDRAHGRQLYFI